MHACIHAKVTATVPGLAHCHRAASWFLSPAAQHAVFVRGPETRKKKEQVMMAAPELFE